MPKKKAKRAPLNRERVFQAAISFADKHGIAELSMRKLGHLLGVEAMSLYKHVKNKDDMLDGMVDLIVAEIEPPAIGVDWKQALRRRAISAHEVLLRHRWATLLFMSRLYIGPAMLVYNDRTIGCLREAGFSWQLTDYAWNALDSHIYGFTLIELNFPIEPDEYAAVAAKYLHLIPPSQFPYLHGMTDAVSKGTHSGRLEFTFGLDLILDGLERLLEASKLRPG